MNELKTVVTFFKNPHLNQIGAELIDLYRKYSSDIEVARQKISSAIERRYLAGKYVSENLEAIKKECGSQRAFSDELGLTEATVSNDKRGYESLLKRGVEEVDQLIPYLKKNNVPATTKNWERIETVLNEPDKLREPDRRQKDERRLEELYGELEDIKVRNEGGNPYLTELADDTIQYAKGVEQHINKQDVYKSGWRSRMYLDFVKSVGWDYITGESAENLDPHHTLPDGSSLGKHGKVADVFTIPVNRATHNKIETGELKLSKVDILEALVKTMALFITTHVKEDE